MPRASRNADLWNFPGGISDWVGKGHAILNQIVAFQGRDYDSATQVALMQALKSARLFIGNPKDIQGRKILNSFAKVGLIDTESRVQLTQKGRDYLSARTLDEKRASLRSACESMEFWNPVEKDMSHTLNVKPYPVVLYLLYRLGYLSNREIEKHVLRIKNNGEVEQAIQRIKDDRAASRSYSPNTDEKNRAGWMMSLFSSTDLITRYSGKIYPNTENASKIITIIKPFAPDAEIILEKEVESEIKDELAGMPTLPNLDDTLGALLAKKSRTPRSVKVVRKTNLYKREIALANLIKKLYNFTCQVCGTQLKKRGWRSGLPRKSEWDYLYAETAHIKDISTYPQYDIKENMLCLCSNCHKNLDNKVYELQESAGVFTCRDIVTGSVKRLTLKPQHGLRLFP